jgi:hypothetical protein
MNNILKVTYDVDPDNLPAVPLVLNEDGTIKTIGDVAFVDYSAADLTFTYDRAATYDGVTVYILVKQDDGTYKPEMVDLYTAVFGDTNATGTALDGFTQAADDALQVIEFVHEYESPRTRPRRQRTDQGHETHGRLGRQWRPNFLVPAPVHLHLSRRSRSRDQGRIPPLGLLSGCDDLTMTQTDRGPQGTAAIVVQSSKEDAS